MHLLHVTMTTQLVLALLFCRLFKKVQNLPCFKCHSIATFAWDGFGPPVAIETNFTNISCKKQFGNWKIIKVRFLNLPKDIIPSHQDFRIV